MRAFLATNAAETALLEDRRGPDDLIVAIGPEARHAAESRGWAFRLLGDLLASEENQAGRRRAEAAIDEAVAGVNALYAGERYAPLREIGEHFRYEIHMLVGQLLFSRQLLDAAARGRRLVLFENLAQTNRTILGVRPHPDVLFAGLARVCGYRDVEIVPYRAPDPPETLSLKRRVRAVIGGRGADLLYRLAWHRAKARLPRTWLGAKRRVLMLGGMFDWSPVLFSPQFMARHSATFKMLDDVDFGPEKPGAPAVRSIDAVLCRAIGAQEGAFDLSPLSRKIDAFARHAASRAAAYERLVERHDAVVASAFVSPQQRLVATLAALADKPVVCYQHGEMNLYPEVFKNSFYEVGPTTHYFAYGESVVSQYRPYLATTRLKEVVVTGSTRKKPGFTGGNLVVYATGKWLKTVRPYIPVVDPDARLYDAQKALLRFLEEYAAAHPEDRVVIKANNTRGFNRIPFSTPLEIDYTSAFTDLLSRSKLVILDTPGTTAVEAAGTPVPLFVLSGRTPWYPEPLALLGRRAVVEEDLDALLGRLREYASTGRYPADPRDRAFADAYGGARDAESAVAAAAASLDDVVERRR